MLQIVTRTKQLHRFDHRNGYLPVGFWLRTGFLIFLGFLAQWFGLLGSSGMLLGFIILQHNFTLFNSGCQPLSPLAECNHEKIGYGMLCI
jgi:hypothetical protein